MSCTIIVGGFFGDEGKGKIVAHIAYKDKPVIISRGGVGRMPDTLFRLEIANMVSAWFLPVLCINKPNSALAAVFLSTPHSETGSRNA